MHRVRGRLLTESRRGSIYNLVSLYWYNLYCEAFEMSCDLVTFPFFGAFAPCSDKQLKKKNKNIKHLDGQSLLRDLQTGQRWRPSPNSAVGWGGRVREWDTGQSRTGEAASPTWNALSCCVLAGSSAVNYVGPQREPWTGPLCPGPQPQARAAAHMGGGGRNPTPCPQGPALLTSDLQVGEGLHGNGDAER